MFSRALTSCGRRHTICFGFAATAAAELKQPHYFIIVMRVNVIYYFHPCTALSLLFATVQYMEHAANYCCCTTSLEINCKDAKLINNFTYMELNLYGIKTGFA